MYLFVCVHFNNTQHVLTTSLYVNVCIEIPKQEESTQVHLINTTGSARSSSRRKIMQFTTSLNTWQQAAKNFYHLLSSSKDILHHIFHCDDLDYVPSSYAAYHIIHSFIFFYYQSFLFFVISSYNKISYIIIIISYTEEGRGEMHVLLCMCGKLQGQTALRKRNKNYRFTILTNRTVHQQKRQKR